MFMLNLLDSLPRLRLSDDHMKVIIWVMRQCGTPNVPAFTALRSTQDRLTRELGVKTTHHRSSQDNEFYANGPSSTFRLDWSNPLVRAHMRLYPEASAEVSEIMQAEKAAPATTNLKTRDLDLFPHMWADWERAPYRHFYIREVAKLQDGRYVLVLRWIVERERVCADVHDKQYNAHTNMYLANLNLPHEKLQQEFFIRFHSTSQHASSSEQFHALYKDAGPDHWIEAYDCAIKQDILFRVMPHIKPADNPQQSETCSHIGLKGNFFCRRCKVGGSAEEKESNEGYDALFTPGEPRTPDETERVVKSQLFRACRGEREAVEELQTATGVKDRIAQFWIEVVLIRSQAERKQRISDKETRDSRLNARSLKGDERKAMKEVIISEIQHETFQWLVQQPQHSYDALPVDSPLRKDVRRGDHYNPLLGVPGVDVHRDTSTEILHTYLVGEDKYVWHDTSHPWSKKEEQLFAQRLESSCIDGLSIPAIRAQYMVQYKNSLVGKHYKTLQQLAVFHLHDLCSPLMFELWKATGELGALIWMDKISDMDQYVADLQLLIANLLDIWALIDPNRIIVKSKLHILSHLIADVPRFGPAILYSTEIFECWNSVFRMCSVLSNRQAPSRDIAGTLAEMETFKHVVSGGWWKAENGEMIQASGQVRAFLQSTPELQRRLGWVDPTYRQPGTIKLEARHKQSVPSESLQSGENSEWQEIHGGDVGQTLKRCVHVISRSRDVCKRGSWVFYQHPQAEQQPGNTVFAGRISEVFLEPGESAAQPACARILIQPYTILDETDEYYNMPILVCDPTDHNTRRVCIAPEDVLFAFNAQHDCHASGCAPTGTVPVRQERQETARVRQVIEHVGDANRYILNMHALHNAALIRQALPRKLTAPKPYIPVGERTKRHHEIAGQLQVSGPQKRADAQAKAAETRARNKTAKAGHAQVSTGAGGPASSTGGVS
ncbi:uncharacterized protein B0H18DRAFT_881265 [Fomitopsis serialis]|uniref:uncharacterized protein n=1 Tax=Fomitopsis serialis TaxID=139415 RepID=UPI00200747E6|nr:uncharacterized protein B0H18DRAFT_881265 [Neoantrodia serialis]KAH9920179.1 hypothetical protein B0H18DRAFT_881265 [Neoantrodia serialis]